MNFWNLVALAVLLAATTGIILASLELALRLARRGPGMIDEIVRSHEETAEYLSECVDPGPPSDRLDLSEVRRASHRRERQRVTEAVERAVRDKVRHARHRIG